jgi:hypothetical protein
VEKLIQPRGRRWYGSHVRSEGVIQVCRPMNYSAGGAFAHTTSLTIMLTAEQANAIADEALAQQRRDLLASRNRRARRVSWFYKVPCLASCEPFQQADLFAAAERRVAKSLPYWSTAIAWLCLLAGTWYWAAPRPALSTLFGVVAILGIQWVRIPFVRRQLTQLVSASSGERSDANTAINTDTRR